jgi:hypothetical protein
LLSITAPQGDCAATASIATTAARPSWRDAATSGTGSTDIRASLIVSFATSGSPSSLATAGASVDFPLAGGPDTTTNSLLSHATTRMLPALHLWVDAVVSAG